MQPNERQGGIRVEYSNRIERLLESLADDLDRGRGLESLFDPPRVVVPNRNVEKFLKFELADRFGVVGDVDFSTLEAWLRDALPREVVALDEHRLTSAIVGLLCSPEFVEGVDALEPVRSYLAGDGSGGRALRTYQLARRLAANFREYGYSRIRMLEQWRTSDDLYTSASQYRRTERWQRHIWRTLFTDDGLLDREAPGDRHFELFTEYWRQYEGGRPDGPSGRVYLFGLSHVAPVYGQIFERLAEVVDLRFYILNPCREFWEDVVYDEEEEVLEDTQPESEFSPPDFHLPVTDRDEDVPDESPITPMALDPEQPSRAPLPLVVWGRAGRDHVHMLNRLTGYTFDENWVDPVADGEESDEGEDEGDAPTLLEAFQGDVLRYRRAEDSRLEPGADDSIRFVEAPGVRRELEVIADAIWRFVIEHDDVNFNDIAVILNPRRREEYQMHLEAVFEEVRGIPFNQVDAERGDGSRLLGAAKLLFELPLGEFNRRELGALLVHPNVAANYDEADPEEWERWCEQLAIYHGADREDHAGTHIDRDLYNWDQGVTRLVLGAFLEERPRGSKRVEPFELDGNTYVPEAPFEMVEPDTAGRWIELVRRLIGQAKITREREDSLGGWLRWMADWLEEHLAPADPGEEAEFAEYLEALRTAAEADLSEAGGSSTVPYRVAVEYAHSQLASQTYERGHYLATGVVVSSFVPQRPIPFDAIFMTGLSAQDFPGSSPRTPVDLRTAEWHEGDLWDRDRERYMFFETLLSARRRVTCSWVARNPMTGEDVEPSSVVREFQHVVEQYVGESGMDELVRSHPLRRFDARYFEDDEELDVSPTFHPSAGWERRAELLREEFVRRLGGPETRELDAREVARAAADGFTETFGLVDPPNTEGNAGRDREERRHSRDLPFRALRKFLVSPLQGWAQYRLGLVSDDEESVLEQTNEPFELASLDEATILREAFEASVHQRQGVDEAELYGRLGREYDFAVVEGRAPTGPFSPVAEQKLSGLARAWANQLGRAEGGALGRFRFGAPAGDEAIEAREALRLEIERGDERQLLELTGDTNLVDLERQTVFVPTQKKKYQLSWRYALRGWIQGLVLSSAGEFEGDTFEVALLHKQANSDPKRVRFGSNAPEAARAHLESLAAELWFDAHDYRFAISELDDVVDESLSVDPEALRQAVWKADQSARGGSYDSYGPVDSVWRYDIPSGDADALEELVKRRMGPFVRGVM